MLYVTLDVFFFHFANVSQPTKKLTHKEKEPPISSTYTFEDDSDTSLVDRSQEDDAGFLDN